MRDFVSLDMGGTSNDVAVRREGGRSSPARARIGPYPLRTPMVDVNTIGAGGGSIAWIDAPAGSTSDRAAPARSPGPRVTAAAATSRR